MCFWAVPRKVSVSLPVPNLMISIETFLCGVSDVYKDRIEILMRDIKSEEGPEVYKTFYDFIKTPNPKVSDLCLTFLGRIFH